MEFKKFIMSSILIYAITAVLYLYLGGSGSFDQNYTIINRLILMFITIIFAYRFLSKIIKKDLHSYIILSILFAFLSFNFFVIDSDELYFSIWFATMLLTLFHPQEGAEKK